MKKNSFYAGCSAFIILTIIGISAAQAATAADSVAPIAMFRVFPVPPSTARVSGPDTHMGISIKAIRDFKRQFKEVTGESWEAIPDGFVSTFKQDGITNRIYYNKAGNWQFTVKEAGQDLLPHALRASVRSEYYDYTITCVHEIQSSGNITYVVNVEDKKTSKKIRISQDREFEIIEDLVKE